MLHLRASTKNPSAISRTIGELRPPSAVVSGNSPRGHRARDLRFADAIRCCQPNYARPHSLARWLQNTPKPCKRPAPRLSAPPISSAVNGGSSGCCNSSRPSSAAHGRVPTRPISSCPFPVPTCATPIWLSAAPLVAERASKKACHSERSEESTSICAAFSEVRTSCWILRCAQNDKGTAPFSTPSEAHRDSPAGLRSRSRKIGWQIYRGSPRRALVCALSVHTAPRRGDFASAARSGDRASGISSCFVCFIHIGSDTPKLASAWLEGRV